MTYCSAELINLGTTHDKPPGDARPGRRLFADAADQPCDPLPDQAVSDPAANTSVLLKAARRYGQESGTVPSLSPRWNGLSKCLAPVPKPGTNLAVLKTGLGKSSEALDGMKTPTPTQSQSVNVSPIEVGARVSQGQPLFSIADTKTLVATGKVDELDVNALRLGADVEISGEAFPGDPIRGHISGISAEAATDQGARAPSFEIRVSFPNDDERRKAAIKLGMSAKMMIEVHDDNTAMLIPLASIGRDHGSTFVQVRDRETSLLRRQDVALGATTTSYVEVLSGLRADDVIVWTK